MQPELTPLIFSEYIRNKVEFTQEIKLKNLAESLSERLEALMGKENTERMVFIARIGKGKEAYSRSLRLSVDQLKIKQP